MATERQVGFSRGVAAHVGGGGPALLAGCSDASCFSPIHLRSVRNRGRRQAARRGMSTVQAPVRSPARRLLPRSVSAAHAAPERVFGKRRACRERRAAWVALSGSYNHWSAEEARLSPSVQAKPRDSREPLWRPPDVLLKVNGFSSSSQVQPDRVWSFRSIADRRRCAAGARGASREGGGRGGQQAPRHVAAKADAEEDDARAPKASQRARGRSRESPRSSPSPTKRIRKRPRRASLLKRRPRPPTKRPRSPPSPTTKRTKSPRSRAKPH